MRGKPILKSASRSGLGLFTLLFTLISFSCFSQDKNLEYVVLTSGDTLFGKISQRIIAPMLFGVQDLSFAERLEITGENHVDSILELNEIAKVFKRTEQGAEIYVPKSLDLPLYDWLDLFLVRELIIGSVSLYETYIPKFRIDGPDEPNIPWIRKLVLERGDQFTFVPFRKFNKEMSNYFHDYPELSKQIRKGRFARNQLGKIVERYNSFMVVKPNLMGYVNGYVELKNGFKWYGKLKVYEPAKSCVKVRFADEDNNILTIDKSQIEHYRRGNENYCQHKLIEAGDTTVVFLLEVVNGPVSLYRFTSDLKIKYHRLLPTIEYGEVYKFYFEKEDVFTLIDEKNFHLEAAKYFSDAPKLAYRIDKRELGYNNLIPILQIYAKEIDQ